MQLRTVVITVLLSTLALLGTGVFLSQQIASGLFQERFRQVESEANRGLSQVKSTLEAVSSTDRTGTVAFVRDTLRTLEGDGATVQRDFILTPLPGEGNIYVSAQASGGITSAVVPEELATAVRENQGQYWQSTALPTSDGVSPGLVFGTKVALPPGREYALYLVYDLESVQETLNYIHRILWIAGALLLVVIGGIGWYVTRQSLQPVAHAAAVSEKLAAGQLEERMEVHGADEVARLAQSFNRMADSLQDQIQQLETLSHMQQRFVSDVSHELRTPLTTVRMAAEVLHDARDEFDPINRRSAELLYNQVERFQSLLNDLLEISRFDAGVVDLDSDNWDIKPIVQRAVDMAQIHADRIGSELRTHYPQGPIVASMDPRRIERVVRNLVLNAVEHSESKPIDIFIGENEHAVAVSVRDHGIGLAEEAASRVFDRFWRADPARARTTGGSGLGLSIATEDTRLHGGLLQAWGQVGDGSNFLLTLPKSKDMVLGESPLPLIPADAPTPEIATLISDLEAAEAEADPETEAASSSLEEPSTSAIQGAADTAADPRPAQQLTDQEGRSER
ncbi:MtrAB system histidine kinase MtrB [Neomicrococcus aestuarii]|nr:MtrAB system histidine kinase MtrB [Neomicrococcus aestuarii]